MFSFIHVASSAYVSIDFGSFYAKSTLVDGSDSPEITLNYETSRFTPSFIALKPDPSYNFSSTDPFQQEEGRLITPLFGQKALDYMEFRPWMGTGFLPMYYDLKKEAADKFASQFHLNSSVPRIPITDLQALYLNLYIKCVAHNKKIDGVLVVIPATFTIPQRRAIESSIKATGYKFLQTIDDADAIADFYGIERYDKFVDAPQTVLFVDVGATRIAAYAIQFELVKESYASRVHATRLSYETTVQGGAFLTEKVAQLLREKYNYRLTDQQYFNAAEKLKKRLLSVKEDKLTVEDLNNEDVEMELTIEELESLTSDLTAAVAETAKRAMVENVTNIELIGGSSRLTIVPQTLADAFPSITIGRTLNADEALAVGGGYASQFLANIGKYQSVKIDDKFPLFTVQYNNTDICTRGGNVTDQITIPANATIFNLTYVDLPDTLKTHYFGLRLVPKNSIGLAKFSERPFNVTDVRGLKTQNIHPIFAASPTFLAISNGEEGRKRYGKLRSDLEQLALKTIEEIDSNVTFSEYSTEKQRTQIMEIAEGTKLWLWDNPSIPEGNLTHKLRVLVEALHPIHNRMKERHDITGSLNFLNQTLLMGQLFVLQAELPIGDKSNLNQTLIDELKVELNKTTMWISEINATMGNSPKWQDLPFKNADVLNRTQSWAKVLQEVKKMLPDPKQLERQLEQQKERLLSKKGPTRSGPGFFSRMKNRVSSWFSSSKGHDNKVEYDQL